MISDFDGYWNAAGSNDVARRVPEWRSVEDVAAAFREVAARAWDNALIAQAVDTAEDPPPAVP
jgi:hypothetical protein